MNWNFLFFFNSILLGVGLAMDAFSVSIANALNEPDMPKARMCKISGVYSFFQFIMPMIGWICVHTIVVYFSSFQVFIPWIALILLAFIGGNMIVEYIRDSKEKADETTDETSDTTKDQISSNGKNLTLSLLIVQGIATSIDALSVGFTIADYGFLMAFIASVIIAVVTFFICMGGLFIGRSIGGKLASKANLLGGCILIAIGLEIFIKGVFL